MKDEFVDLGLMHSWGGDRPLRIFDVDRRRHLYVVGQTGTGKTTLLKNIVGQDLQRGAGVAVLDPHGDLADELLDLVPKHRIDEVHFLDPTDAERPFGFNPFFRSNPDERSLIAENLTAIFKSQWRDSWGPRLEYILRNTFRALLDAPDHLRPSFLCVPLTLINPDYRNRLIGHVVDPQTRIFFDELSSWPARQLAEALSPVQNKIGEFLSNPYTRNILGQWKPSFDLFELMNRQQILIVRLPKGTLGESTANLFGSFIAGGLQQAAMRRAAIPVNERTDFHLVIDEFPNFTTGTFANVLSESRKYGLTLTIGHQYINQMSEPIEKAVFGNVGSLAVFRVSAEDAIRLGKELGDYSPATLRALGRGQMIARVASKTGIPRIYHTVTRPDVVPVLGHSENIRHQSRVRFGRDRGKVEDHFSRWIQRENPRD